VRDSVVFSTVETPEFFRCVSEDLGVYVFSCYNIIAFSLFVKRLDFWKFHIIIRREDETPENE